MADISVRASVLMALVSVFSACNSERRQLSEADLISVFGSSTQSWCRPSGDCATVSSSCSQFDQECTSSGQECGKEVQFLNPEICASDFGNQYCSPRHAVCVECSVTYDCTCLGLSDCWPVFGSLETKCVTITTDKLTCFYQLCDDCFLASTQQ